MNNCYSVTTYSVQSILGLIDMGAIAIPEIQRPFVWDATKVRDLVDSLYNGYPTGYLITWKNPDVKIKGGGISQGRTVLIDGQQRVTAITASLAGKKILNDDYEQKRIQIAFNPQMDGEESPFAVLTPIIEKDRKWIPDISVMFQPGFNSWFFINEYISKNEGCNSEIVSARIGDLVAISTSQLGVIVIDANCTIDEVTDIFIRINSKGAVLSQADFAMSKIAADEEHGGLMLRKAIDYYCHTAIKPEFWDVISTQDPDFMRTEYAAKTEWLKDDKDDIYNPDYNDMLRVAFMYRFGRGKLADLISLLSGRDFETRDYKSEIADESYVKLKQGILKFMDKNNFQDFVLALRSAGFIAPSLISGKGAVNFSYNLYLRLRDEAHAGTIAATDVKRYVQRWFVMSLLTGRYSGSSETIMDRDIRRLDEIGFLDFYDSIVRGQLSDAFWDVVLPQNLNTTSTRSPGWLVYSASQVQEGDNTLFSNGVKVSDVVSTLGDVHHIFPKNYLRKELNATKGQYNQIANYTYLEKRINIAIGADCPGDYFTKALNACNEGESYFGNIQDKAELTKNLADNCIPTDVFQMTSSDYQDFLAERRQLMAQKIRDYFYSL